MQFIGNPITQPLYDTVRLAATAGQTVRFFQNAQGDTIGSTVKTAAHTNLTQKAQLPDGWAFEAKGFMIVFPEYAAGTTTRPTIADMRVVNGGYLELSINKKDYGTFPTIVIPSGASPGVMFSNITAGDTNYMMGKGIASQANYWQLDYSIRIEGQRPIVVDLTVDGTIAAVTDVMFMFLGNIWMPK